MRITPVRLGGGLFSLFVIGFIAIMFIFIGSSVFMNMTQSVAQQNAVEYASHIQGVTETKCNRYDTDGDGYVSCTLFRGSEMPVQIECGVSGCRLPRFIQQQ